MTHRAVSMLLAFGLATGVAACSSSSKPAPSPSSSSTSSSSSVSTAPSSPDFSSTPAAPTSSAGAGGTSGCPTTADKCDDFSNTASGWPVANESHFYAGYDNYLGGTYRVGERTQATIAEDSPIKATDVSNNYSVQLDADVVAGTNSPATSGAGFVCWHKELSDGGSTGFVLSVTGTTAEIGLWDGIDGTYHAIASKPVSGLQAGQMAHLTALCIQGSSQGGSQAQLSLAVNGTVAVTAAYDKSLKTYDWSVADGIAVIAQGQGSDFFYDNFALTSKCTGDFC